MSRGDDESTPRPTVRVEPLIVEIPLFTDADLAELERLADEAARAHGAASAAAQRLRAKVRWFQRVAAGARERWGRADRAAEPGSVLRVLDSEDERSQKK